MFTSIVPYIMPSSFEILNSTNLFSEDNIIPAAEFIVLLSLRCIFSVSNFWGKSLKNSLNMGVISLSLAFIWITACNLLTFFQRVKA